MAKCTNCNGTGIVGEGRLGRICGRCKGIGFVDEPRPKKKEPTNEEWLWSATTEQLAEFLNLIIRVGPYENEPKDFWEHVYGRGGEHGAKSIVEWLKQPHTTKE